MTKKAYGKIAKGLGEAVELSKIISRLPVEQQAKIAKRTRKLISEQEKHMTLADRCRIHASKMDGEGWYVTANVLSGAADEIDRLFKQLGEAEARIATDGRLIKTLESFKNHD